MTRTKRAIIFFTIVALVASLLLIIFSLDLHAAPRYTAESGAESAHGYGQPTELFGEDGVFTVIVNTLLYVIGALSVIMMIIGGIRYVVSGGSSSAVSSAKNTVLYALVGLIIAVLAYAAINFILVSLGSATDV